MKEILPVALMGIASIAISSAIAFEIGERWTSRIDGRVGVLESKVGSNSDLENLALANLDRREKTSEQSLDLVAKVLDAIRDSNLLESAWWCFDFRCERTKERCEAARTMLVAQLISNGATNAAENIRTKASCRMQRLAWCSSRVDDCVGTLDICMSLPAMKATCRGVE